MTLRLPGVRGQGSGVEVRGQGSGVVLLVDKVQRELVLVGADLVTDAALPRAGEAVGVSQGSEVKGQGSGSEVGGHGLCCWLTKCSVNSFLSEQTL